MSDHVDDLFAELALDLDAHSFAPSSVPRAHLDGCERCAREVSALTEVLTTLSLADAATTGLPAHTHRACVLAATGDGVPHGACLSRLARLFDLDFHQISRVVHGLARRDLWEPTPLPTVRTLHFQGGPRVAHADNGFVWFGAGTLFPRHRHVGEEITIVVTGRLILEDGEVLGPGERLVLPNGSEHTFRIPDDEDCVCAVRLEGSVESVQQAPAA